MIRSQSPQVVSGSVSRLWERGFYRLGAAWLAMCVLVCIPATLRAGDLRLATFDVDVTPPIGGMLAYDPVKGQWELGLRGRGVILLGTGEPIVLCAIDWIGISNESHDVFRQRLAEAAGTTPQRVAVHTVHQHDAPECGFANERLLRDRDLPLGPYESTFTRAALERLAVAVQGALAEAKPVTHLGLGQAEVREVASNRRLLGPDGKVRATRWTTTTDPNLRAEPEGTIDPVVSLVSFWNDEQPLAVLSYYACHPQSYYRTGVANPDFPGVARFLRQLQVPDALHVHFNGAGGNLGAGKYNDGSHSTRWLLAQRLADGMKRAWEATEKSPLAAEDVDWKVVSVALPPAAHLNEPELETVLRESDKTLQPVAAAQLAWLQRCQAGHQMDLCCLCLGKARVLHMPGELFVEYQLAAKQMRRDLFVAMAAYGDYGPGYIGTAVAYEQGGYETGSHASSVAPGAEAILLDGMRELLWDDISLVSAIPAQAGGTATYCNPVIEGDLADPAVILHEGVYYLYATGDVDGDNGYRVYTSTDLVDWKRGPVVFQPGERHIWAPDLWRDPVSGKFFLYYTANQTIGVAEGDGPLGPFTIHRKLFDKAIDAHLFRDDDGRLYLYFVQLPGFRITVQPMAGPTEPVGESKVILHPESDWETRAGHVTEGPWIIKRQGRYYLLYSGSGADTPDYAVGYAVADHPTGPFTRASHNPIVHRSEGLFGPGHGCAIRDGAGRWWHVYHQKRNERVEWGRFLCIDPLRFDQDGNLFGIATRGTPQPAPTPIADRLADGSNATGRT